MIRENCSLIGSISKSHGIGGQLMLRLNGDFADDIEPGEPLFVEVDEVLVPFFIEEVEAFPDRAIVRLEFINSPLEAKKYIGKKVYLEKSILSDDADLTGDNGGFYIGYTIMDKTSGIEGIIREFIDNPLNPLFLVANESSEFLLPVHSDYILNVDNKKKLLILELPEGLADI
jgi:16S rRNA processing protein RimM